MHRVHHSVIIRETNSNFGFNLSWWDYFFGTYRDRPVRGHGGMTIGLARFRDPATLDSALAPDIAFRGGPRAAAHQPTLIKFIFRRNGKKASVKPSVKPPNWLSIRCF